VFTDVRTRQHDAAMAQPGTVADRYWPFRHDLHGNREIEVFVAVILIGDVDMMAGPNVIADLDSQVTDDATPFTNEAPVADADDRISDHLLAGDHAGRKGDLRPKHRAFADVDVVLVEQRVRRKADHTVLSELAKPFAPAGVRTDRTQLGRDFPATMHGFTRCTLNTRQQSLPQRVGHWVSFEHGGRRYRPG
jgi:hypothetical protein